MSLMQTENRRMKNVDNEVTKEEFSAIIKEESSKFKQHVKWVKVQYKQLKNFRNGLPADRAIM